VPVVAAVGLLHLPSIRLCFSFLLSSAADGFERFVRRLGIVCGQGLSLSRGTLCRRAHIRLPVPALPASALQPQRTGRASKHCGDRSAAN
jgi:hypothetical protein